MPRFSYLYLTTLTALSPYETDTITEAEIGYKISEQTETESQVIIHCTVRPFTCEMVRIWKNTFLFDKHSNHSSKLLHVENISIAPQWTIIDYRYPFRFTLLFEGLPKSCILFDLKELIPEPYGFECLDIPRNHLDIYHVSV